MLSRIVPTSNELSSDKLLHKHGDFFNPPALTNFLGVVQSEIDLTSISSINFPPLVSGRMVTASLYVDDIYFPSFGTEIGFTWYPDKIIRESEYQELYYKSTTIIPFNDKAVLIKLDITNKSNEKRKVDIRFGMMSWVTKSFECNQMVPPFEEDHEINILNNKSAILFSSKQTEACSVQGIFPKADHLDEFGASKEINLRRNETTTLYYLNIYDENKNNALLIFEKYVNNLNNIFSETEKKWDDEIEAIFTPGNSIYSGSLPALVTKDEEISRLYYTSILGTVYFRRDNPYSVYGRAYDTLMPRYWQTVTFIWDYQLSSLLHSLLDPKVMEKYLELWMHTDIHTHFGTEFLKGKTAGMWYSVNDFAMTWIVNDYLRWNGNFDWLDKEIAKKSNNGSKKVSEYLFEYAENWKRFKTNSGLADYGGINNLLECVSI